MRADRGARACTHLVFSFIAGGGLSTIYVPPQDPGGVVQGIAITFLTLLEVLCLRRSAEGFWAGTGGHRPALAPPPSSMLSHQKQADLRDLLLTPVKGRRTNMARMSRAVIPCVGRGHRLHLRLRISPIYINIACFDGCTNSAWIRDVMAEAGFLRLSRAYVRGLECKTPQRKRVCSRTIPSSLLPLLLLIQSLIAFFSCIRAFGQPQNSVLKQTNDLSYL